MPESLRDLGGALRFFTRLPWPGGDDGSRSLASAAMAFPLAGLVIGAIVALVWSVAAYLLPALPAAGIAIAAGLLVTGALHEDGLSDCADGLGGSTSRERCLEIMRDSRIGAFGAAALMVTIGLRWSALSTLDISGGAAALLITHAASRAAILPALTWSTYARSEGLGSSVSQGVAAPTTSIALAIGCLLAVLFGWFAGLVAVIAGYLAAYLFLKYLERRIGGYTGDGLGAMQQFAEITTLLVLAGYWG